MQNTEYWLSCCRLDQSCDSMKGRDYPDDQLCKRKDKQMQTGDIFFRLMSDS